ncbi:Response regulator [Candidatus Sulfobium mesophilum]|uniref:Response regulator n=1 Tax=Candidatus Sulfobium mesophilum TaxID=2016548 RepID=A0A2U3QDV3_9BACT|nr:Response regulator [Candidatus Sulfobium mesophilum]
MKILIVDDDEINLLLTKLELSDELWEVITASNGQEAMELFEIEKPDVVIVDVVMPGIDGITLLKKMKQIRPETPAAIFTGYDQKALSLPDEADAFVVKSSSYKELKEFVKRYAPKNK